MLKILSNQLTCEQTFSEYPSQHKVDTTPLQINKHPKLVLRFPVEAPAFKYDQKKKHSNNSIP